MTGAADEMDKLARAARLEGLYKALSKSKYGPVLGSLGLTEDNLDEISTCQPEKLSLVLQLVALSNNILCTKGFAPADPKFAFALRAYDNLIVDVFLFFTIADHIEASTRETLYKVLASIISKCIKIGNVEQTSDIRKLLNREVVRSAVTARASRAAQRQGESRGAIEAVLARKRSLSPEEVFGILQRLAPDKFNRRTRRTAIRDIEAVIAGLRAAH